jgi:hypothetical protein
VALINILFIIDTYLLRTRAGIQKNHDWQLGQENKTWRISAQKTRAANTRIKKRAALQSMMHTTTVFD